MVYTKFTAFIVTSIIATPIPYYNTEIESIGQEKSANDFHPAYNTADKGADETKVAYDDVKAITDSKQAYGTQEQVSGDMTSAYDSTKSTDGVMGYGQDKSGNGEKKQAYGDAKSIEELMSYDEAKTNYVDNKQVIKDINSIDDEMISYGQGKSSDGENKQAYVTEEQSSGEAKQMYGDTKSIDEAMKIYDDTTAYSEVRAIDGVNFVDEIEVWAPVNIEEWKANDVTTSIEEMNNNEIQGYSSKLDQDWDASNKQGSYGNVDWDDLSRNNQGWDYTISDIQGRNSVRNGEQTNGYESSVPKRMDDNGIDSIRQSNVQLGQSMTNAKQYYY